MQFLNNLPIKRKLVLVTLVTCGAALALACTALFWFQSVNFRKGFAAELESLGAILAQNSSAPLAFDFPKDAVEVLSALKVKPYVSYACVFDSRGKLFAEYGTREDRKDLPALDTGGKVVFNNGYANLTLPIPRSDAKPGHLHICARFQDLYSELLGLYAAVLAVVLASSLVVILLLSSVLQRLISKPIMVLAEVARAITEKEDYSARATLAGKDEVGLLTAAFNRMLDRIQSRDAALRESQQRFEVAMMGSRDGLWDWDLKADTMYFSPRWKEIIGYSDSEMPNLREEWEKRIDCDSLPGVRHALEEYLRGARPVFEVEFRMRHRDGSWRWILSRGAALRDKQGIAFRMAGSHTDITSRKTAEERERERIQRSVRHQGILLSLSQLAEAALGEQLGTILGESSRFLGVERVGFWRLSDDASGLLCDCQFLKSSGNCVDQPIWLEAGDYPKYFAALCRGAGLIISHDVSTDALLSEFADAYFPSMGITSMLDAPVTRNGHVLGVVCFEHVGPRRIWTAEEAEFCRSIAQQVALVLESHDRRRAEESLRLSEQRYRSVVNSVKEVIFQTDATGSWTFLNPVWTEITGYSAEESLGCNWASFVHPDDKAKFEAAVQSLIEVRPAATTSSGAKIEIRFLTKAGEQRWIDFLAHRTVSSESSSIDAVSGTLTDITRRKEAEHELARLNRELQDTARQAGMAEVATGVLHNVGNVLNSVNVSANLLSDRLRHAPETNLRKIVGMVEQRRGDLGVFLTNDPKGKLIPEYLGQLALLMGQERAEALGELQQLGKNIEHIKEIVAMQQSYARVAGVIEDLQVKDLVEDALRIQIGGFTRHGITIKREFTTVPAVRVDKHKVLQILVNIFSNAKHAMKASGQKEKQLSVGLSLNGNGRVKVILKDNGVGIAPENLTRIFQHGFTTKADGHGFGLHSGALAAKEMGGSLTAASDGIGKGATFTLELPIAHTEEYAL